MVCYSSIIAPNFDCAECVCIFNGFAHQNVWATNVIWVAGRSVKLLVLLILSILCFPEQTARCKFLFLEDPNISKASGFGVAVSLRMTNQTTRFIEMNVQCIKPTTFFHRVRIHNLKVKPFKSQQAFVSGTFN